MTATVSTGYRTLTPGACSECGATDDWSCDGRGTVYCSCQCCSECGEFDGHNAGCVATVDGLLSSIDDFTRGYLECALWASTHQETEEPLDDTHGTDDIDLCALQSAIDDCRAFQADNAADLAASDLSDEQAGHDFWLTRNRHGAGFWDRGLGSVGDRLSEASRPYGEADLYVGDDGKVHGF
jgi:hypothetical protein